MAKTERPIILLLKWLRRNNNKYLTMAAREAARSDAANSPQWMHHHDRLRLQHEISASRWGTWASALEALMYSKGQR